MGTKIAATYIPYKVKDMSLAEYGRREIDANAPRTNLLPRTFHWLQRPCLSQWPQLPGKF